MRCEHCKKPVPPDDGPEGKRWCNDACLASWNREHPEDAARWIPVERLNPEQRAELDALLGNGEKC